MLGCLLQDCLCKTTKHWEQLKSLLLWGHKLHIFSIEYCAAVKNDGKDQPMLHKATFMICCNVEKQHTKIHISWHHFRNNTQVFLFLPRRKSETLMALWRILILMLFIFSIFYSTHELFCAKKWFYKCIGTLTRY